MRHIAIIGAGEIGQAIKQLFGKQPMIFWDNDPKKIKHKKSLETVLTDARMVFLCMPTRGLPSVLPTTAATVSTAAPIISVSKGIELKSRLFVDELLAVSLPKHSTALLYGPMLAEEIMANRGAVGVLAAKNKKIYQLLHTMITVSTFRLEYSTDVHGVAVVGVLKNIYSFALGIADGLRWGHNMRGWLIQASLREMEQLVKIFNGRRDTVYTAAGLGDLIATGMSDQSHNFTVGQQLARGGTCAFSNEGCVALPIIVKQLGTQIKKFPLLHTLYKITVSDNAPSIFQQLLKKV
ncbi:MAG: hypothetical protein A2927_03130 [Candidatus Komeilibacteria bacterium RIFCSPLOWO2_01_FULL_45_10]|uniref:Glycerol-3-phosphate dehydrogenase n=2 Tax=Parcubacteria group TaxID=1794811 RepID=A0A1G1Y2R8_9BACT|nr:MAG: hypothetical protein A2840_02840 [Candidatus Buchananbacteria bacterium RIFCSPHIGHO2_01_FULL_47_11b]OGY90040.1 MAG: hypothetical protein A2927_03130 [Candidatus Komeilibacteria bacterium RIFCSPLOWO2_01_FULL_45_10]